MQLFDIPQPTVPVEGGQAFPIRRIYCIGRNYAKHVAEMGYEKERTKPVFFAKPADAVVMSGSEIDYPPGTSDFHHEIEMVLALGKAGRDVPIEAARDYIVGYAVGIDLTRRDLQREAKDDRKPWEVAKGFDDSAPISPIRLAADIGHPRSGRIWLAVNGQIRQEADLNELIWGVSETIAELSKLFSIAPGDLLFTGTPAGVGPLERGDEVTGGIEGIGELKITIR